MVILLSINVLCAALFEDERLSERTGRTGGNQRTCTGTYYKGNERIDEATPKYALLSTHAGRKTFICNALALGIPAPVVMKWTEHSDYKAMKPYIDIADDIRANAMNKFNQL